MNALIITLKLRVDEEPREQQAAAGALMEKLALHTPGVTMLDGIVERTFYVQQTDAAKAGKAAV